MPSATILCKDCAKEKKRLEKGGAATVISCAPLEGEEKKPKNVRKCRIVWKNNPI